MGEVTGISWADHTFNGWIGCTRVSEACRFCYAETFDRRVGGGIDPADGIKKLRWGPTAPRTRTSVSYWNQPLKWNRKAQAAGIRHRVFCASLADVFEDREELIPWRWDLFDLIAATQNLDWLMLTKRPENINRLWPGGPPDHAAPNIWLGTTVEDQRRADERILALLEVPAVVRFLSCEPLLEPVRFDGLLATKDRPTGIDWVICGGESGPRARTFDLAWARSIREQCASAGTSFWMKQVGDAPIDTRAYLDHGAPPAYGHHGADLASFPRELRVQELPIARTA